MGYPREGTVRHVVIRQPSTDQFYWVVWEQFRINRQAEWTLEAKKFETYEEARAFSVSL